MIERPFVLSTRVTLGELQAHQPEWSESKRKDERKEKLRPQELFFEKYY